MRRNATVVAAALTIWIAGCPAPNADKDGRRGKLRAEYMVLFEQENRMVRACVKAGQACFDSGRQAAFERKRRAAAIADEIEALGLAHTPAAKGSLPTWPTEFADSFTWSDGWEVEADAGPA